MHMLQVATIKVNLHLPPPPLKKKDIWSILLLTTEIIVLLTTVTYLEALDTLFFN